jgi:hypothetical protein
VATDPELHEAMSVRYGFVWATLTAQMDSAAHAMKRHIRAFTCELANWYESKTTRSPLTSDARLADPRVV